MIEEAIVAILKAHAGLNAIVAGRIYPVLLPQTPTLPAVTYQLISDRRDYTHDGDSGLRTASFQFSCWGDGTNGFRNARDAAQQVVNALSGYRGVVSGTEILGCFEMNRTHLYESTTLTHQQIVDFDISAREA